MVQWKNMSRLCVERQALTMYKWRNGLRFLPDNIMREKPPARSRRIQVNRNQDQYEINKEIFIPCGRTAGRERELAERSPIFQIVNLWNDLPENLPNLSFNDFRWEIRKYEVYNLLQTRTSNFYRNGTF